MRVVLQRVSGARVLVDGTSAGAIGRGLVALVGVGRDDTEARGLEMGRRIARLRVFPGGDGETERAVGDVGGAVLVVSQFTLLADLRRGNRPSWSAAAPAGDAEPIVAAVARGIAEAGVPVATGIFGAGMRVELVNDGPVTLVLDDPA